MSGEGRGPTPRIVLAAGLLIAGGALAVLASARLFSFGGPLAALGVVLVIAGVVEILAGIGCLRLRASARIVGMAISAVAVLLQAAFVLAEPIPALVMLGAYGFVVWSLATSRATFGAALAPVRP